MNNTEEPKSCQIIARVTPSVHARFKQVCSLEGKKDSDLVREAIDLIIDLKLGEHKTIIKDRISDREHEIKEIKLKAEFQIKKKEREIKQDRLLELRLEEHIRKEQQKMLMSTFKDHNAHLSIPFLYTHLTDERFAEAPLTLSDRDLVAINSTKEHCFEVIDEVRQLVGQGVVTLIPLDTQGERYKIVPNGGIDRG